MELERGREKPSEVADTAVVMRPPFFPFHTARLPILYSVAVHQPPLPSVGKPCFNFSLKNRGQTTGIKL